MRSDLAFSAMKNQIIQIAQNKEDNRKRET